MIKDKFNLHFTYEITAGTVISGMELIDYTGENFSDLRSKYSWFGRWLESNNIDYKKFNEEEVGRYIVDFFNDTFGRKEPKREFVKIEIL